MPSTYSSLKVALLPLPMKNINIPQARLNERQQTHREGLNDVLQRVLRSPTLTHNPSTERAYYNIFCANGNFRSCKLVSAASLADCPAYSDQHHHEQHISFQCKCPNTKLGDYIPLTSNTAGGITSYRERSAIPTRRRPMTCFRPPILSVDKYEQRSHFQTICSIAVQRKPQTDRFSLGL
jgi:hypothetical protein